MAHKFVWTAVPRGVSSTNKLLLSIVVSPQLEAAANATLSDIGPLATWADRMVKGPFTLTVTINGAAKDISAPFNLVDKSLVPDQEIWNALFTPVLRPALNNVGPATTAAVPVRSFTRSTPGELLYRTYPIRDVADGLKERLAASVLNDLAVARNSPANQLLPALLPASNGTAAILLAPDATEATRLGTEIALRKFNEFVLATPANDTAEQATARQARQVRLNAMKAMALGRLSTTGGRDLTPATLQSLAASLLRQLDPRERVPVIDDSQRPALAGSTAFGDALVQVAQFHAVDEQHKAAVMNATEEKYDIHQLLKLLTGYPALQRKLGLILDVELDTTLNSIAPTGTISVKPKDNAQLANADALSPKTAYVADATANKFLAASGTPLINDGFLVVSDAKRFFLESLDVDSAALKAAYTHSDDDGAPRTAGIALVFENKKAFFTDLIKNANDNSELNAATLHAEDLMRGVRIDVRDESAADTRWKSLCQRRERFEIGRGATKVTWPAPQQGEFESEGAVRLAVTKPRDTHPELKEVQMSEVLARWEGWSLCVKLPQQKLPGSGDPKALTPEEHENQLPITPHYSVVPRSLPKLRFDRKYRLRARIVDMAGNSVPIATAENDTANSCPNPEAQPFTYRRFEPVEAPKPLARASFERKSSPARHVDRLVITETRHQDDRAIVPGRTSLRFTEWHEDQLGRKIDPSSGAFDGALLDDKGAFTTIDDPYSPGDDQHIAAFLHDPHVAAKPTEPFLPDPLASGAIVTLLDRRGHPMQSGNSVATVQMSYYVEKRRVWPHAQPFIVALEPATPLDVKDKRPIAGLIRERIQAPYDSQALVTLQPGEILKVRMSSTIAAAVNKGAKTGHHVMALWDITRAHSRVNADLSALSQQPLEDAAQDGQLSLLTPDTELTLVHAVRRPVSVRISTLVAAPRSVKDTSVTLTYGFDLHRCSTGRLDGVAKWKEWLDRITDPKWQTLDQHAQILKHHVDLDPDKDKLAILHETEAETVAGVVHEFGDTKHRTVTYSSSGVTRFREYYPASKGSADQETGFTLDAGEKELNIKSTARPNAPKVLYIIPSFEWRNASDKKTGRKVSKRVGGLLRVYLDRPWYSSGEAEQLAAILFDSSAAPATDAQLAGDLATKVTRWGSDPIWITESLPDLPTQESFRNGDRPEGSFTLPDLETSPIRFKVVAFTPEFDADRRLWRADIGLEPGSSYTPFIRLALARFQKDSIDNCHLSAPVLAEFAQLAPDRTACVAYNGDRSLSVTVNGFSYRGNADQQAVPSEVTVALQEQWADLDSDVSWHPVPAAEYQSVPQTNLEPDGSRTWTFSLTLQKSRKDRRYRIVVTEVEKHKQDDGLPTPTTHDAERITYLDVLGV